MSILLKFSSNIGILNVLYHYSCAIVLSTRRTQNAFAGMLGFPSHLLFSLCPLITLTLDQSLGEYSGVLGKVCFLVS